MARVVALALSHAQPAHLSPALDVVRATLVIGCALALILAGVDFSL